MREPASTCGSSAATAPTTSSSGKAGSCATARAPTATWAICASGTATSSHSASSPFTRSSGEPATLGRIFLLRFLPVTLLGAVPLLGNVLTLVDILLIFRDSQKCLHDQFADTIVVKAE